MPSQPLISIVPVRNFLTGLWLNRCWRQMLETVNVDENFELLLTDYNYHHYKVTNIKLSSTSVQFNLIYKLSLKTVYISSLVVSSFHSVKFTLWSWFHFRDIAEDVSLIFPQHSETKPIFDQRVSLNWIRFRRSCSFYVGAAYFTSVFLQAFEIQNNCKTCCKV